MNSDKARGITAVVLGVFCWLAPIVYGLLLVLLSFPPESGQPLDPWFQGMQTRMRIFALYSFAIGVAAFVLRNRIGSFLDGAARSTLEAWRRSRSSVVALIKADGGLHWTAFGLVLLAGVFLRLAFLDQPMRYDEAATYLRYSSKTLLYCLTHYYPQFNNQILHTVLVHFTSGILGGDPWTLRLPAFLAGILLPPVTYLAGRTYFDRHSALLAAGLASSSSMLVMYSTNARGYMMTTLFFMLLLYLAKPILGAHRKAALLIFGLVSALGLYTIVTMLIPFLVAVVWVILLILFEAERTERRVLLKQFIVCLAVVGFTTLLLYSSVFIGAGYDALLNNPHTESKDLAWLTQSVTWFPKMLWTKWNISIHPVVQALLVLGVIASVVLHRRISTVRPMLLAAVVLGCVPMILKLMSFGHIRVWLFLLPLYFIMAAAGLVGLLALMIQKDKRVFGYTFAGLGIAASLFIGWSVLVYRTPVEFGETGVLSDGEEMAQYLLDRVEQGDAILSGVPSDGILEYYLDLHGFDFLKLVREPHKSERLYLVVNTQEQDNRSSTPEKLFSVRKLESAGELGMHMLQEYGSGAIYVVENPSALVPTEGYVPFASFSMRIEDLRATQ